MNIKEYLDTHDTLTFNTKGVSMLPMIKQDRDLVILRKKQPDERLKTAVKLRLRVDVGIVPQQRQVEVLREIFQNGAGAGAAAAVQQHPRTALAALLDDALQLPLIVSSVHSALILA